MTLRLTSNSFQNEQAIPSRHTCDGDDVSPALAWDGVPKGTKSLTLVVEDPDAPDPRAPKMTWVHWIVLDLPPRAGALPEGAVTLPEGAREGLNDWKTLGYRGPCPPVGQHRYFHRLFALDRTLEDLGQPDRASLQRAMQGHILEEASLMGTYAKTRKR